jgi:hypothetical protein
MVLNKVTRVHVLIVCLIVQVVVVQNTSNARSEPSLGSCTLTCLLPGKTFMPQRPIACLDNMTQEHCGRIGRDEMAVRCKSPSTQRLEAKFSTKKCPEKLE